jgi:large subunit ribosomal protein L4
MATFDVFNMKREKVGSIDLADEVFGAEIREHLFYEVVKAQLASKRQGTQCAKNRSAVSGSTKKLYKQKGTGRARHGSIRAPVFVGGGQAHPPRPRDWAYEPPRRIRALALSSALSKFQKEGRLLVIDRFDLAEIKTKQLIVALETLKASRKTLVVDIGDNERLRLSIRNCKEHQFLPPEGVNVYDLLRHDTLILSQQAAKALEERCLKQAAARGGEGSSDAGSGRAVVRAGSGTKAHRVPSAPGGSS